jgi:hypothetical protein
LAGLLALALLTRLATRHSDPDAHAPTIATSQTRTAIPSAVTVDVSPAPVATAGPRSETARALESDGWTMVDETRPDQALVDFDPSLLRGVNGERRLRTQMASAAPRERHVPNLAAVARRASDATTRALAIDALGHIDTPAAQRELLDLLGTLDRSDPARRNVAPLLHPATSDDPFANELARRVDDTRLERVEREQIAFTLALVAERDGRVDTAPFYGELSPEGKKTLARMGALARGGAPEAAKRPEVGQ